MKNILLLIIYIISNISIVNAGILQKIEKTQVEASTMPGYSFDFDQIFKITNGPLAGKTIFFAMSELGGDSKIPKFIVSFEKIIIDQKEIPTIESGWNIVSVEAVMAMRSKSKEMALRVLSILTLEPMSGRSSDYWQQAFVFDLSNDGKINENVDLNTKISELKPQIKTVKALKKYLDKNKY